MAIFLGAWVMLFAALFFAYAVVRVQAGSEWPPFGAPRLPRAAGGVQHIVAGRVGPAVAPGIGARPPARRPARPAALAVGRDRARRGFPGRADRALGSRCAAWPPAQLGRVRIGLLRAHRIPRFARAGGLLALAALALRRARAAGASLRAPRLTALYWDFIALVWLVMYVAIFWL